MIESKKFGKIFGIVYGDKQTEYTPYVNTATEKLWRFEYNPMIDIVDSIDCSDGDWLGILSWKFNIKTGLSKSYVIKKCVEYYESDFDVLNFSPDLGDNIGGCGNFMQWSEKGHVGITELIKKCCSVCGLGYTENPGHIFYANQFIARAEIYISYVDDVIKPCLELLEGELWNEVNKPAGYTAGLELAELKKQTGLDFYNYVPFVLERMFMQYVNHYKLSVKKCV